MFRKRLSLLAVTAALLPCTHAQAEVMPVAQDSLDIVTVESNGGSDTIPFEGAVDYFYTLPTDEEHMTPAQREAAAEMREADSAPVSAPVATPSAAVPAVIIRERITLPAAVPSAPAVTAEPTVSAAPATPASRTVTPAVTESAVIIREKITLPAAVSATPAQNTAQEAAPNAAVSTPSAPTATAVTSSLPKDELTPAQLEALSEAKAAAVKPALRDSAVPSAATPSAKPEKKSAEPAPAAVTASKSVPAAKTAARRSEYAPPEDLTIKAKPQPAPLKGDSDFLEARKSYQSRNLPRLTELAGRLKDHPLESYVQLWTLLLQAESQVSSGLTPEMNGALKRFASAHANDYVGERAYTDWSRLAARSGDVAGFTAIYPKLKWNSTEEDIVCYRSRFAIESAKGNAAAKAVVAARRVVMGAASPQSASCRALADAVIKADPKWGWNYLMSLLQKRRFTLARTVVTQLPKNALPVPANTITAVLDNPSRWYKRNAKRLRSQSASLLVVVSLRLLPEDREAAVAIAKSVSPRISASAKAMLWARIGLTAALDHDPKVLTYYANAGAGLARLEKNPLASNVSTALLWQARSTLRYGTPAQQQRAIRMLPRDLETSPAWVYWRARSLQKTGSHKSARALLTPISSVTSFYGLLACDALKKPYPKAPATLKPALTRAEAAAFEKNPSLIRAQRFYALDLIYEGNREWNWAMRSMSPQQRLKLAEWSGEIGLTHRQINTSIASNKLIFTQRYPLAYKEAITNAANEAGVSPAWAFGLIRQESRFVRFARSRVGAQGLMQVMPRTGRWIAKKVAMEGYDDGQLTRMETNLVLGTQYLRLIADSMDGSVPMATASYNAGPKRAVLWRSTLARPVEGAVFAETIPFNETRDYVANVTTNMVQYSRYDENPVKLSEILGTIEPKPVDANVLP